MTIHEGGLGQGPRQELTTVQHCWLKTNSLDKVCDFGITVTITDGPDGELSIDQHVQNVAASISSNNFEL